jgi:ubiquinone/menaquinone biosynthesis C-methylase UbiE
MSTTYDDITGHSYWEILYDAYNQWIKRHLDKKNLILADLGCGTGLTSDLLLENDNTVFGLDLTSQLLKAAKNRHTQSTFEVTSGDITHLPFSNNSFEGIVCFDTLEHISSVEKAISEIGRTCKSGSMFLFDIPSSLILDFSYFFGYYGKSGLISALKSLTNDKVMYEWHSYDDEYNLQKVKTYRYRFRYIDNLLKSNGFKIIEKRGIHISTMLIPEKIQANVVSSTLSKINDRLIKVDNFLNKFPFMKNRALYMLYACKKE